MVTPNRRPAGSPHSTGGQYAAPTQSESHLDLGGTLAVEDHYRAVFDATDDAARYADNRVGTSRRLADRDAEDLRQDALEQWWRDRQRGHAIATDAGYARTVAHFQATKLGDRMRAEDRRANRQLAAWEIRFEQTWFRSPTRRERDAQAASILEHWPDRRHLPTAGFHTRTLSGQEVSYPGRADDRGVDLLAQLAVRGDNSSIGQVMRTGDRFDADEDRDPQPLEPGTWTTAAIALTEGSIGVSRPRRVAARRISCAALAEARKAPMPQVGCLSHAAASKASTKLRLYPGGVPGAIATWRSGEDDAGTEALFAPFGPNLDEGQRDDVCDLLELGEPRTLWFSAAWVADEHNAVTVRRIVAQAAGPGRAA
ncbi:hypothetical protein [Microlunatus ginsengisoli]|uniref:Uncharacterized protein n=1 Tax=Microlunatus ginsengisoli TaxID=363863 RepID=A0ABP7AK76_9ACTN